MTELPGPLDQSTISLQVHSTLFIAAGFLLTVGRICILYLCQLSHFKMTVQNYHFWSYHHPYYNRWGKRWRSWLRHCATTRKFACSFPDGVIGIFHLHNPSGHTMALGLTQPLAEKSTRINSWKVKAAGA
jgi:hypothetical protein